jgi:hypothetical protein
MKLKRRLCCGAVPFTLALFSLLTAALNSSNSIAAPKTTAQEAPKPASSLDYEFFKARVEPIFLKNRPGHARCYACHALGPAPRYLVKLSPGNDFWTEEQSREIFENVSKLVKQSDPMNSRLLIHPLSPMAGGDLELIHTGGRQFESKDDPDWKTLAAWASGQKLTSSSPSN